PVPAGDHPDSVAVADLNGDGRPDFVTANRSETTPGISVALGNGDGTFAPATFLTLISRPYQLVLADVNGDGHPDIVATLFEYTPGKVAVVLGNSDGTFGAPTLFDAGSLPYAVAVADVNGDGLADVIVTTYSPDQVSVLLGNGLGSFGPPAT